MKYNGPMGDLDQVAPQANKNKKKRRDPEYSVRDLFTALAVCHNVTPTFNNDGEREFQASSPDEIALVKFVDHTGLELIERDENKIILKNTNGDTEEYAVLANFPFSSETKRMGIVVRHLATNRLIFYMKGAEVVVQERVRPNQRIIVAESCENLGMEGLRTLVICQKLLNEDEFHQWEAKYIEAQSSLQNRDEKVRAVIEELEKDMELLGISGVEDKLQVNVQMTIESLRNAGISIWMLTGDKVETATCIAISAGLKSKAQRFRFLKEVKNKDEIRNAINLGNEANTCLVVDGTTLDTCLRSPELEHEFITFASKCPAVLVCRCSPTQKAIITRRMKEFCNKTVASVGDGGNDVAMIQESNVGIGIVGKEGLQASLAADFSITQFCHLRELILWHGRLSYKRTASLAQFVIHRGLIISVIQAVFSVIFYFVAIPIYNGYLMLGYATIYTSLPVFSLVFDTDCDKYSVLNFPPLYKTLQKGRLLSFKTFLIWVWKSIYQGAIILMFSIQFFNDSFVNIVTITFSALVMIELLNVYTEINRFDKKMFLVLFITGLSYFISIILFRNYFDVAYIDFMFIVKVMLIVAIAWLPLHIIKIIVNLCDPSEHQKLEQ